jgi:hypothetical protein
LFHLRTAIDDHGVGGRDHLNYTYVRTKSYVTLSDSRQEIKKSRLESFSFKRKFPCAENQCLLSLKWCSSEAFIELYVQYTMNTNVN